MSASSNDPMSLYTHLAVDSIEEYTQILHL